MMRSMYSGVSGLKTHQTKMDVIGNNIANVNTVAYKSSSITFSELMYQTTQKASGANQLTGTGGINARQIGLGVKSAAISTAIQNQGATQTTGNPFDICINGESFFIVSDGQQNMFTRAGAFNVDAVGNLVMSSNGYNVMGWQADDETQTIKKDTVSALRIMSPDKMTYPPEATTAGYVSGIVDKRDPNISAESGKVISLNFYDNLGYQYTAKFGIHSTLNEGTFYVTLDDVFYTDENNKTRSIVQDYPQERLVEKGGTDVTTVSLSDLVKIGSGEGEHLNTGKSKALKGEVTSAAVSGDSSNGKSAIFAYKYKELNTTTNKDEDKVTYYEFTKDAVSKPTATSGAPSANATEIGDEKTCVLKRTVNTSTGNYDDWGDDVKEALKNLYGLTDTEIENMYAVEINLTKGDLTVTEENVVGAAVLKFDVDTGKFLSVNDHSGTSADGTITLDFAAEYPIDDVRPDGTNPAQLEKFSDISIDWSATNMFNNNGTSTVSANNGTKDGLNTGRKLGKMSGVTVQTNGEIYASYDNGMTRLLGQIAVAEFSNAAGLEKAGENLYKASLNSGAFDGIGVDISASGGYMNTGVLEMSNVDLSSEFTEMITTQRGFQANSRIITVSDTMLEELVNLKR
ncbi:MAG: flagellar hook-basal body complex protein [Lachnospiraceae bacterium]|nr:flagellar hook-basal body complex protein [Lachnospiraceae bacterium]